MSTARGHILLAEVAGRAPCVPGSVEPVLSAEVHFFDHFGDAGQPESEGPWHVHRVAPADVQALVSEAFGDPRTHDAHPDTVQEWLETRLGDVVDGVMSAAEAWEAALDSVKDAVRPYEFRAYLTGLWLSAGALTIGPVVVSQLPPTTDGRSDAEDAPCRPDGWRPPDAEAVVALVGCPMMVSEKGMTLIELACDVLRAFAPQVKPVPREIPTYTIPLTWLNPWFEVRVGERHSSRSAATRGAIQVKDPSDRPLPASMAGPLDSPSSEAAFVDPNPVSIPDGWPPAKTAGRQAWDGAAGLIAEDDWPSGGERLMLAIHWLGRSSEATRPEDALVFAVIAMEALVAPTEVVDGRYRLVGRRIAALAADDRSKVKSTMESAMRFFHQRHGMLHGRGAATAWRDAIDARTLAFRGICRFAENGFHRADEQTIERWFNAEETARR